MTPRTASSSPARSWTMRCRARPTGPLSVRDPQHSLHTNPLGVKGAGEAGAIGSCPAVVNAIIDGLWREYKIDHIDMPATPERVWMAIREQERLHKL